MEKRLTSSRAWTASALVTSTLSLRLLPDELERSAIAHALGTTKAQSARSKPHRFMTAEKFSHSKGNVKAA
jgi:hypothetical protein